MDEGNDSRIKYYRWWPVVVAIPILLFTAVEAWQRSLMPENTYIPSTTLPAINAKDYFDKAASLVSADVDSVAPVGTPASEIGVVATNPYALYKPYTQAQREQVISAILPAIKIIEKGLEYPYVDGSKESYSTSFRYLAVDRRLARALRLAAQDRASKGDYGDAADYLLDGVEMGSKIPHGAPLVGMLVGTSCEDIEWRDLSKLTDKLNEAQCVNAAQRLETDDEQTQPVYQTLVYEERFMKRTLLDLFKHKDWRSQISGLSISSLDKFNQTQLYFESPRTAFDDYTRLLKTDIDISKLPWPGQIHHSLPPAPHDPAGKLLYLDNRKGVYKQLETTTAFRLLELQLALRAYRLAHGQYPASLRELSPAITSQVPSDPFSDNQLFRYRNVGGKYLLYSIGPDAVDNGGRPIYNPKVVSDPYVYWNTTDKGDIVAGVNDL